MNDALIELFFSLLMILISILTKCCMNFFSIPNILEASNIPKATTSVFSSISKMILSVISMESLFIIFNNIYKNRIHVKIIFLSNINFFYHYLTLNF
jgi:hypothetical protein